MQFRKTPIDPHTLSIESRLPMHSSIHCQPLISLFSASLLLAMTCSVQAATTDRLSNSTSAAPVRIMLAQSGSMGGTIGNREKSLSGSRDAEPARPAQRSTPKENRKPAAASSGGGGGNYDGAWSISSAGITCSDTFRETVVVRGTRMTGNYGGGSVSASGSVSGSGNYNGVGVTSQGRFSGRSGSGTFQRSDGCHGRWTASKQ